jgi:hypothetical protein
MPVTAWLSVSIQAWFSGNVDSTTPPRTKEVESIKNRKLKRCVCGSRVGDVIVQILSRPLMPLHPLGIVCNRLESDSHAKHEEKNHSAS